MSDPKILWKPTTAFTEASNMNAFKIWINKSKKLELNNYQDLWNWSISQPHEFWECIFKYYQIIKLISQ